VKAFILDRDKIWLVTFEELDDLGWASLTMRVAADTSRDAIAAVQRERGPETRNFTAERLTL